MTAHSVVECFAPCAENLYGLARRHCECGRRLLPKRLEHDPRSVLVTLDTGARASTMYVEPHGPQQQRQG